MSLDGRTTRATVASRPGFDLARWVAAPRHRDTPGVYGLGPVPRPVEEGEAEAGVVAWKVILRALLNLLVAWELFKLVYEPLILPLFAGRITSVLRAVVPWLVSGVGKGDRAAGFVADLCYDAPGLLVLGWVFGRMGRWPTVWRRYVWAPGKAAWAQVRESGAGVPGEAGEEPRAGVDVWAEFREVTPPEALALLDAETADRVVGDVDRQRLLAALERVRDDRERLSALLTAVRDHGAAACAHPSGARGLVGRGDRHDLLLRQVRLGRAESVPKNPAGYRGVDVALDPALLGTSLLAVGPAGTGKTARLTRPVAEALCLQALTGTAMAVVVGAAHADLGPTAWYDVVVAPADPASGYGLDLFGGSRSPDEAAARLADALLPDELSARAESARLALQQVVLPFQEAFGRPPGVRELVLLLRGDETEWAGLTDGVERAGLYPRYRHQLAQRERQHRLPDDPGSLLADRLALLDRPAFAGCFNASADDPEPLPLFALHAMEYPLRVRVSLPEHSHPEASRILARLVVGQFLHAAAARQDRSLFAGLVVDDASASVDLQGVRALQGLRGANAGAVLALRTLMDLPEQLRTPLFGAVGGRMAFPGLAPWDGALFAEAWGTVWIDEQDVTRTPDTSGGLMRRAFRGTRSLLEGERVQTQSVTTRRVERRRWSPSDLANALPSGHAVVSLTAVDGTAVPPLLVDLREQGPGGPLSGPRQAVRPQPGRGPSGGAGPDRAQSIRPQRAG